MNLVAPCELVTATRMSECFPLSSGLSDHKAFTFIALLLHQHLTPPASSQAGRVCVLVCVYVWLHLFSVYNWDDCEDHFIVRGIEEAGKDG